MLELCDVYLAMEPHKAVLLPGLCVGNEGAKKDPSSFHSGSPYGTEASAGFFSNSVSMA